MIGLRKTRFNGFTLVEVMMAMGIFTLVLSVIALIYSSGYKNYVNNNQKVEVHESMRVALGKIVRGLEGAQSGTLLVSPDHRQVFFTGEDGLVGAYRFNAEKSEVDASYTGVWLPVASNITSLTFNYDPGLCYLTVSIRGELGRSGVIEMETGVYLRVT